MQRKLTHGLPNANTTHYWKFPEKGYPYRIKWIKVAGPATTFLQQEDIIFDEKDLKIRGLDLEIERKRAEVKKLNSK